MNFIHRLLRISFLALLTIVLMSVSIVGANPAQDVPPDPQPWPWTGTRWLDHIYWGTVPPQADRQPVLVFVHGLARDAEDWWTETEDYGVNDMYYAAYQAGHRTAFVTLDFPERADPHSMWDNGETLSRQVEFIASHYDVDQVDIVAHSKGGIDAQAAVVHYGAWQHVRNVFTLGTPHQGSELSDLLYSDWADWLARLLGGQNDATYSMTTGYMQYFRTLTDGQPENDAVQYYSGAGTDWGPEGSVLRLGAAYLSTFGPNDGLVTVASTELPGGQTLFVQPYHHFNIHMGHTAFPWIDAVLHGMGPYRIYLPLVSSHVSSPHPSGPMRQEVDSALVSGVILRGGRLSGSATEAVPVAPRARAATFDLLVSEEAVIATLTGPDGLPHRLQTVAGNDQNLFDAALHRVYATTQPMAGKWTIHIEGPPGAAYLLVTIIDSPLQVALGSFPKQPVVPGERIVLKAHAGEHSGWAIVDQIAARVTRARPRNVESVKVKGESVSGAIAAQVPREEGVYVVSADVRGMTSEGMPFERSFVRSFAVGKPETLRGEPALLDR